MAGLVVALSLGSAAGSAVSTTLKKRAATDGPAAIGGGGRSTARFVRHTLASPWWLAAILADVVGVGLQVAALHVGALAVVQPLLVSGLVFALVLRHVGRWRFTVREVGWAAVLVACLIAFLLVSGATAGVPGGPADRGPAVVAALAVALGVAICLVAARREVPAAGRAGLLGVAVGAVYATTAALIKAAAGEFTDRGLVGLVSGWQLYAVLVVGAGGLFLAQVAFQAGPLTASLPAVSTVDPLLSVLIGVVVYDERLRPGPGHGALLLGLVALLVVAVLGLAGVREDPTPPAAPDPARPDG